MPLRAEIKTLRNLTCSRTGETIALLNVIASSGEGTIWTTNRSGFLAKVYHTPTPERLDKLEVMIANPPEEPNAHLNHISFAWPQSLLWDRNGQRVGFLLPEIEDGRDLLDLYNPYRRKRLDLQIDWRFLHVTALNIAAIVQKIHAEGYVLGDIKPQNILVNNRALPSIIDTDSFQVRSPNGMIYRCPVGSEEFTPAELLNTDLRTIDQTEVHDRFRLAVIIYLLLFSEHPFKGVWSGVEDPPEPVELIRRGSWPYATHSPLQPSPLALSLEIVHPELQHCFRRCFNQGYSNPAFRPSAADWHEALELAIAELKPCKTRSRHTYSQHYRHCPWCERSKTLGVDIFPGKRRLPLSSFPERLGQLAAWIGTVNDQCQQEGNRLLQDIRDRQSAIATRFSQVKTNQQQQLAQSGQTLRLQTRKLFQIGSTSIGNLSNLRSPLLSLDKLRLLLLFTSLGLPALTAYHYGTIGGFSNLLGLGIWLPFVLFWGIGGALSTRLPTTPRSILAIGIPALGVMDALVNPHSFWPGGFLVFALSLYLLSLALGREEQSTNSPQKPGNEDVSF